MQKNTKTLLTENLGVSEKILDLISSSEDEIKDIFNELDDIAAYNQYKVLDAFQKNNIGDRHFNWNTGYGYDDAGREALECIYADLFKTKAASKIGRASCRERV